MNTDVLHTTGFADILREHHRSYPQHTAVVCGETRLNYPNLDKRVSKLANALAAQGFTQGDTILWLGQNCHRLLESFLAAAKLGGVFCPANWRQSADELAFVLGDLQPNVVLWQGGDLAEPALAARDQTKSEVLWLQHDGDGADGYEAFIVDAADTDLENQITANSPLLCMYTAAFTGQPKGALLTHEALLLQGLVNAKLRNIDADYTYLNSGPLFHMATFMPTAATFVWGGTNVFTPRADAEDICRLVDHEKCNGALIMGPIAERMVEANKNGKYDLKSLRAYSAGEAFNAMVTPDSSAAARRPGGYGQTEVCGQLTFGALGIDTSGTSGRSMPGVQIRIVNAAGSELPAGEVGEIVARGPTVMHSFIHRPQDTAARRKDGWHHTNDLGRREEDGSLTFIGPMARLIKSAAENIYPAEVEACVRNHPDVAGCAVIGTPDPKWSQNVKAIVVLNKGVSVNADDIIAHCKKSMASYKKPKTVEFVEGLPRKGRAIDYDALDTQFGGGGYPGAAHNESHKQ